MNELIKLTQQTLNDEAVNTVNARELHEFLGSQRQFSDWIKKLIDDYGFVENKDFCIISQKSETIDKRGRAKASLRHDYFLTIDTAKEICMVQRNDKGREARQYFIDCEKQLQKTISSENQLILNTVLANTVEERMLAMGEYRTTIVLPLMEFKEQAQPKVEYHDDVLKAEGLMSVRQIAKDFGMTAQKLNKILHEKGIQFKQGGQWLLYKDYQDKGYTKSETFLTAEGSTVVNTKWTQKGRQFIYELLKGDEQ